MNAADGLKKLEANAASFHATRLGASALLAAGALLYAYCSGRSAGATNARTAAVDSVRHVLAESSAVIEARIAARAPTIQHAETIAVVAREAHRRAARRIAIVDDSTVRVDSGPPVHEIPATIAIPEIRTCTAAIDALMIHDTATVAQLADVTVDRDVWKRRALLDEANAPHPSRFGFKTGLAAGAAVVVIVLHFVR